MAAIIALANRKGGSGKTTTTINLADGLARQGKRVLVVDADSQAQSTISCGIMPYQLAVSLYELLHIKMADSEAATSKVSDREHQVYPKGDSEIAATIIRGKQLFDLIPSKPDLSALEIELANRSNCQSLLKDLLLEVENTYDYILIDLPPSLGLITVNGLVAANWLLIPIEPTFLSMDGLAQMTSILYKINAELNPELRLMGIVPIKCDLRTNLARNVVEEIRQNFGDNRLLPPVRNDIKLAEAPSFGKTIFDYAANCRGASDYLQLAQSIIARSGE
ncbi:MAG: ParA family protein [Firmicutes bacterium HGW-Firmicutes-15]|nr:MAG: ParA family protein [Firmicutes bacterium HGW-Firmicutes-15]